MNYGRTSVESYPKPVGFQGAGFKSEIGIKEAMARLTLEEIRSFCDVEFENDDQKNEARQKMIAKLQRCRKFLKEDPLGQKVVKHFGTIINASTDSSIGTPPDIKLTKKDYTLAEQYGIDPEEAYVMRMNEKKMKMQQTSRNMDITFRKGLAYTAQGVYLATDPKGFAKDTLKSLPPPVEDVPLCPTCGEPAKYVAQYDRYYCMSCRKYLPKDMNQGSMVPPPSEENIL